MNFGVLVAQALALALACVGCKKPPHETHLADLVGTSVEVVVTGGELHLRLDARGCPALGGDVRADVDGVALTRVAAGDAPAGSVRGCSAHFSGPARPATPKNPVITVADGPAKVVVELLPFAQRSGFKLTSRASLAAIRAGDSATLEAYGPVTKLSKVELTIATRAGDKLRLPATDFATTGRSLRFTIPQTVRNKAGDTIPLPDKTGALAVVAEGDAIVRCEGASLCAAPVRLATEFALGISP